MAKFTFKDTGKEIKVGDVFYYTGYIKRDLNETRFITTFVKSCTVKTIVCINRNTDDEHHFLITDDINSPTFTINDCLYSISQDIFLVN